MKKQLAEIISDRQKAVQDLKATLDGLKSQLQ
jgi:hypothetical protein